MFPMLPRGTSIPAGESAAQLLMRGTADVHVAGVARGPSRRVHRALTRRRRRPCQDPPRQIRGAQRRRRRPRRRCGQVPGLDSATLVLAVMGADRPPLGALHWRRPCHGPSRQLETQRRRRRPQLGSATLILSARGSRRRRRRAAAIGAYCPPLGALHVHAGRSGPGLLGDAQVLVQLLVDVLVLVLVPVPLLVAQDRVMRNSGFPGLLRRRCPGAVGRLEEDEADGKEQRERSEHCGALHHHRECGSARVCGRVRAACE
ncbi:hypothetical protein SEVIR_9G115851v4 [Setaria viridis]